MQLGRSGTTLHPVSFVVRAICSSRDGHFENKCFLKHQKRSRTSRSGLRDRTKPQASGTWMFFHRRTARCFRIYFTLNARSRPVQLVCFICKLISKAAGRMIFIWAPHARTSYLSFLFFIGSFPIICFVSRKGENWNPGIHSGEPSVRFSDASKISGAAGVVKWCHRLNFVPLRPEPPSRIADLRCTIRLPRSTVEVQVVHGFIILVCIKDANRIEIQCTFLLFQLGVKVGIPFWLFSFVDWFLSHFASDHVTKNLN